VAGYKNAKEGEKDKKMETERYRYDKKKKSRKNQKEILLAFFREGL